MVGITSPEFTGSIINNISNRRSSAVHGDGEQYSGYQGLRALGRDVWLFYCVKSLDPG